MENLPEKINGLPRLPGCYIFKNKLGTIIYIGKSKSLKSRVQQYFQNVDAKEGKYKWLSQEIADLEIIRTDTERDALILECQLIKKHLPKYNAQLKGEKVYPYICIDWQPEYPTISITKERAPGNRDYFGFFRNEDRAFEAIELMNAIWQTPLCAKTHFSDNHRPCLNFHLKKCCAPCGRMIDQQLYLVRINEIRNCLKSRSSGVFRRLRTEMQHASDALDFEQAMHYRDLITALEQLQKKSKRLNTSFEDKEVYLFFRAFNERECALFYIRDGRVRGRMDFCVSETPEFLPFVQKNNTPKETTEGESKERFLAKCLVDIFADKYYVTVPRRAKEERITSLLEEAFREFCNT